MTAVEFEDADWVSCKVDAEMSEQRFNINRHINPTGMATAIWLRQTAGQYAMSLGSAGNGQPTGDDWGRRAASGADSRWLFSQLRV